MYLKKSKKTAAVILSVVMILYVFVAPFEIYFAQDDPTHTHTFSNISNGGAAPYESAAITPEQYTLSEAQAVADRVLACRQENSLVLGCISDIHYSSADDIDYIINAGKAMNYIKMRVGFDAYCNLGDYTTGAKTTTKSESFIHFSKVNESFAEAAYDVPNFRLIGNHDILPYNYQGVNFNTQQELYDYFGKYSTDDSGTGDNFGYHDYEAQKIRVICLNTCDCGNIAIAENTNSSFSSFHFSSEQLKWFASALDLSSKNDASDWGIIMMGHYPLDFWNGDSYTDTNGVKWQMGGSDAVSIINAYTSGSSGSLLHDGAKIDFDFQNKNSAKIICYFNSHIHNYAVGSFGRAKIPRITIPNALNGRENQYTNKPGFYEETTQTKTAGTQLETSFNIVVVNKDEQCIHLVNYGAGYDRTVKYAGEIQEAESISLSAQSGSAVYPGRQVDLQAQILPETADDKTVRWSVSDTDTAVVSAAGSSQSAVLTARKEGTVEVTAQTENGLSAKISVCISPPPAVNCNTNASVNKWIFPNTKEIIDRQDCFTTDYIPFDASSATAASSRIYVKFLDNSITQLPTKNRDPWYIAAYKNTGGTLYCASYIRSAAPLPPVSSVEYDEASGSFVLTLITKKDYKYIRMTLPGSPDNVLITIGTPPDSTLTHSRVCDECGYVESTKAHDLVCDKTESTHQYRCTQCDFVCPAESHSFNYSSTEASHSKVCSVCGYSQSDAHIFKYSVTPHAHQAYCGECRYYLPSQEHTFVYLSTGDMHEYVCSACGYAASSAEHEMIYETDENSHKYRCKYCDYSYAPQNHAFDPDGICACGYSVPRHKISVPDCCAVKYSFDAEKHPRYYLVEIRAPEKDESGNLFTYWKDGAGNVVGTYRDYTFYNVNDEVFIPVYSDAENYKSERQKAAIASRIAGVKDNGDGSFTVVQEHSVSSEEDFAGHGVIITTNPKLCAQEYMNVFSEEDDVIVLNAKTSLNSKTGILEIRLYLPGTVVWARPYVTDGEGEYHYGNIQSFTVAGENASSGEETTVLDNVSYASVQNGGSDISEQSDPPVGNIIIDLLERICDFIKKLVLMIIK